MHFEIGDKVQIGNQTGEVVRVAYDEVMVKIDGSSDPGMYYPFTAFSKVINDEIELELEN